MTLKQALGQASAILSAAGIEEAALESEVLLRHLLDLDRNQLFLNIDSKISDDRQAEFFSLVERRRLGEPVAYITGHREFYGLDFIVNRSVLIPRPESELLVDRAIELSRKNNINLIADIGTGSGAIAVSLAVTLPKSKIYAIDISPAALEVARQNASRHQVEGRVNFMPGDLLESLPEPVDIIVANLPYVTPADMETMTTAGYEPELALDGGPDGLRLIRRLLDELKEKLNPGGCLLLETGQGQAREVAALIEARFPGYKTGIETDLAGIERMVVTVRPVSAEAVCLD